MLNNVQMSISSTTSRKSFRLKTGSEILNLHYLLVFVIPLLLLLLLLLLFLLVWRSHEPFHHCPCHYQCDYHKCWRVAEVKVDVLCICGFNCKFSISSLSLKKVVIFINFPPNLRWSHLHRVNLCIGTYKCLLLPNLFRTCTLRAKTARGTIFCVFCYLSHIYLFYVLI